MLFIFLKMDKKDGLAKLHGYVASDGGIYTWKCKDIHGKRLRIRRRLRTKFFNKEKALIEDFIKSVKKVYPWLKSMKYYEKRIEVEIRNDTVAKEILALGKVWSSNWEFPKDLNNRQKRIWIKAFVDGEGTVNNENYNRYVAVSSINLDGLKDISRTLKELGISSKIYTIRYKSYTSYRLKISRKENLVKFNKLIRFNHPLKQRKLNEALKSYK